MAGTRLSASRAMGRPRTRSGSSSSDFEALDRGGCPVARGDRHAGAPRRAALAACDVARRGRRAARLERARGRPTRQRRSMRLERVGDRHGVPARRAAARIAHLLVLRHAFPARDVRASCGPLAGGPHPASGAVGSSGRPTQRRRLTAAVLPDRRAAGCAMLDPWTRGSSISVWADRHRVRGRGHRHPQ